ncbi:trypsin-like peptidase domain-containing protein [soil metagenome]
MSSILSPDHVADLVERLSPHLVRVDGGHRWGGTGTVWADDLVVTANHGVERDENVELGLSDGTTLAATVVGRDPSTGVALLRAEKKSLLPATFRTLDDLRVGHFAVSLGRPGKTVRASFGIVSTLGAEFRTGHGGTIDRYVEADANVPPGWSGGLLVDLEGRAIGVTHRGLVRNGAVAIPKITLDRVIAELAAHGKVRRGYLGVGVHPVRLPDAVAKAAGAAIGLLVNAVAEDSPAEKGGLHLGDVIVALDGTEVNHPFALAQVLRGKVDVEVTLKIVRAGGVSEVKLRV